MMTEADYLREEIYDLIIESNRRCNSVRVLLIQGHMTDDEGIREYAVATAPLASAARRIEEGRAS